MDQYQQTEERVRNARHAYYAMISYIDDKVGQLLEALKATGLSDNTIVIFTADHGEMLGERGLWYKMNFFEWSARVPLIFCAPKEFARRRVAQPVSLADILSTLVGIAGKNDTPEFAAPIDGRSLTPFLFNNELDWDDNCVVGEFLAEGAIAPLVMIRRDQYKYVYSEPDPEQLYNLETDPHELQNLAGHSEYEDVRAAFKAELMARWDLPALNRAILASQRRRRLVSGALMTGHHTAWDFQPHQDASQQYMRNHLLLDDLERRARFPTPEMPVPDLDRR
jgi:choline-sulfatase